MSFDAQLAHAGLAGDDETTRRLLAAADAANEKIKSCHERLACPRCRAPRGKRCHRVGMGRQLELKHPHRERWEQDVPAR